jgi:hypothetical protein
MTFPPHYRAAWQWQSRAVLGRHLTVYRRNWHTAALPPLLEPIILLLAFGVGLGGFIPDFAWRGRSVAYLAYLAPGINHSFRKFRNGWLKFIFNSTLSRSGIGASLGFGMGS